MLYLRFKKLIKEIKEICKLQRLIYLHIHGISSKFKIKADNITMNRKGNDVQLIRLKLIPFSAVDEDSF